MENSTEITFLLNYKTIFARGRLLRGYSVPVVIIYHSRIDFQKAGKIVSIIDTTILLQSACTQYSLNALHQQR